MMLAQAETRNLRLLGHTDLNGVGDGMQIMRHGPVVYVGHMGKTGTSIVDVADPRQPRVIDQIPNPPHIHCHKVQVAGNILLVNHEQIGTGTPERTGFMVYDVSNPRQPREIAFFETGGKGVHRMWYADGRYAYVSARIPGYADAILLIVDLADPTKPTEIGRWWLPGLWTDGGEELQAPEGQRYAVHHAIVRGERAYVGHWDYGAVILDISDRSRPETIGHIGGWAPEDGGHTHTALPLLSRGLLVTTDEATAPRCQEVRKHVRMFDITDERQPRFMTKFPVPEGDFCNRGLRFGPHNLHENRPGALDDERFIYVTYFNAGLRVFDTSDPTAPREVASFIPETPAGQEAIQLNDLLVDANGLIYVTDRIGGGLYILEPAW